MFLVIWGFRVRSTTIDTGTFFCPTCGGDRSYAHKRARRWFTFFWIPLIPLKQLGELVECGQCHSTFNMKVLDLPTTAEMATSLLTATREAVIGLLRIGGSTTAAIEAAQRVLAASAGRPLEPGEVEADVYSFDVSGLMAHLGALSGSLNEHGKESFLAGCVEVAAADGTIDPGEQQALDQLAQALLMTPAHARGVIAQTVERMHQA